MNAQLVACPICRRQIDQFRDTVECPACGRYQMDWRASAIVQALEAGDRRRAGLSAYVRRSNRLDETPYLSWNDWEARADAHVHTGVSTKLGLVLERLAELTSRPGETVPLYGDLDYPLFDAASSAEVGYLLETLVNRGDLNVDGSRHVITAAGWDRLDPAGAGGVAGACFVAMSFMKELDPAYDLAIRPAVADCGFDDVRLDRVEHSENINDKIIADIRRAQFMVADFTLHPPGVYFEAGFALGLGKLVIWTCRKNDFHEKVHFDTRPYNHILWESEDELREKLANRIRALVPNAR